MRYRMQEGSFDLPDGLHDQTVNIFTATPSGASPFTIVITRSEQRDGSLSRHVDAEIALMAQALAGFELLWQRVHSLDGRAAIIVASKIDGPNGPVEQRQIFCFPGGSKGLTITATAAQAFDQEQLGWLNDFASSLTFNS